MSRLQMIFEPMANPHKKAVESKRKSAKVKHGGSIVPKKRSRKSKRNPQVYKVAVTSKRGKRKTKRYLLPVERDMKGFNSKAKSLEKKQASAIKRAKKAYSKGKKPAGRRAMREFKSARKKHAGVMFAAARYKKLIGEGKKKLNHEIKRLARGAKKVKVTREGYEPVFKKNPAKGAPAMAKRKRKKKKSVKKSAVKKSMPKKAKKSRRKKSRKVSKRVRRARSARKALRKSMRSGVKRRSLKRLRTAMPKKGSIVKATVSRGKSKFRDELTRLNPRSKKRRSRRKSAAKRRSNPTFGGSMKNIDYKYLTAGQDVKELGMVVAAGAALPVINWALMKIPGVSKVIEKVSAVKYVGPQAGPILAGLVAYAAGKKIGNKQAQDVGRTIVAAALAVAAARAISEVAKLPAGFSGIVTSQLLNGPADFGELIQLSAREMSGPADFGDSLSIDGIVAAAAPGMSGVVSAPGRNMLGMPQLGEDSQDEMDSESIPQLGESIQLG